MVCEVASQLYMFLPHFAQVFLLSNLINLSISFQRQRDIATERQVFHISQISKIKLMLKIRPNFFLVTLGNV